MMRTQYQQRMVGYGPKYRKRSTKSKKTFLRIVVAVFGFIGVVGWGWFRINIINQLPNIEEIENFNFKQATTITDRNGVVLYRMFEENRQYVAYDQISSHFINGLVATEDQRFWNNAGIDPIGMVRAWITDVTQWKTHGASTLTQQLIKMIMLTPEKKIERKLKEIILAVKLSGYVKKDISSTNKGLSEEEVDRKVKEKIIELYSNLIFLGNNAYGIEAASQTYFATKAKDLSVLQAAILAGMPQAPSRYDPFTNRPLLMGKIVVQDKQGNPVEVTEELRAQIIAKAEANINSSNLESKKDDQAMLDFLNSVLDVTIQDEAGNTFIVHYETGRKDVVLARMFEESYITEFELKKALIEGYSYQFTRGSSSIKAPHFVFWIINQLQQQYSEEVLQKGGLTVITSLDYKMQEMAEASIIENKEALASNKANNSSMIYADSQNGDVLAYVGSLDYNNNEIDGQVDMIQSSRQPGSTIKPLIYALWFMKLPLTIDTPIYDLRMKIGEDEPNNADGGFWGLTTVRQALAGSRNIPAIKMFFSVGGENVVKGFLASLGISNLQEGEKHYGYPIAIGASEMKMLDLTNAYMHLSAMGKPARINPILEIRWPDNSLLYKKEIAFQEQIIPTGVAYLIRKILSENSNLPSDRVRQFTAPGRLTMATKSGTTNIVKWEEKLPRDGRLMTYTPSKVLWLWWGNTDGSAMYKDAYGWWLNSGIRKSFLNKLLENGYIQNETVNPTEIKEVVISKISGKLASADTPLDLTQKTVAYLQTAPTTFDASVTMQDIDMLCMGTPSELTPPQDLSSAYFIIPETIMPDKRDLTDIQNRWQNSGIERYKESLWPILLDQLTGSCAELRQWLTTQGDITLSILKPLAAEKITRSFSLWHQSNSTNLIKTVKVLLDNQEIKTQSYNKRGDLNDIITVSVPNTISAGNHELKIIVIDDQWYSNTKTVQVALIDSDTTPPYLMDTKVQIEQKTDWSYAIALLFADESSTLQEGTIEQNGTVIHSFTNNIAQFSVTDLNSPLSRVALDSATNKWTGTIDLTKYKVKTNEAAPE
jgi:penicillin-binding protein 1A